MLKINVYAESALQASKPVLGHSRFEDDRTGECKSDDHLHLEFDSKGEAIAFAEKWERPSSSAFRKRVAKHIREEVELAG